MARRATPVAAGPQHELPGWHERHCRLRTDDGVALDAVHLDGGPGRDLAVVLAHGFTGSWRSPALRAVARRTAAGDDGAKGGPPPAGVVGFDFRGHGRSGGESTVGDKEVRDLQAAVAWARALGYAKIATVGFSMGGSVTVRHAALIGGVDAVVSVSGPSRWYYRGTRPMRRLHRVVETRPGRLVARYLLHTRIAAEGWDPVPEPPAACAARLAPTPLLVVHGDADAYFPLDHARALAAAAGDAGELWVEPGFGHAEAAASPELVGRILEWVRAAAARPRTGPARTSENGGASTG